MIDRVTRRDFIRVGMAAGVAAGLTSATKAQNMAPLRLAVIGVGSRGAHLLRIALAFPEVQVPALCDINEAHLNRAVGLVREERGNEPAGYSEGPTEYRRLLERGDVDAVLIATPMQLHGPMAIDSLRAGKHVLSEVAACMTLEECWGIVKAQQESKKLYMLAENCCYYRHSLAVLNMVREGLFGQCTYAECGYVHDCRALAFNPDGSLTWRGELARDYIGNLYPTHALGPVARWLGINRGDRLESLVACTTAQASMERYAKLRFGADHPAAQIEFAVGDSTSTLIRTAKGVVIDLRYDTVSARPCASTTHLTLQGMTASYEDRDGRQSIWIDGRSDQYVFEPFAKYAGEYDDPLWKEHGEEAAQSGHGGADYFVVQQFLEAVREGGPSPIDAIDAATWSCIIPLSAASIRAGSAPQEIPDFSEGRWQQAG
ncbi:MAG: Gfo/Idh/MocA family protein [Candidatus Zipacnadales bacterium]